MVVRIEPPKGSGTVSLFGLFSRQSSAEENEKLEDVSLTLKQRQKELRTLERQISDLRKKAEAADDLDEQIKIKRKALEEIQDQAEQKLIEFRKAEAEFAAGKVEAEKIVQAISEQQDFFNEKKRLLAEKEEALMQREDVVEERKARAEQIERAIKRAEIPLERRHKRLEAQILSEEKKLGELKSARLSALEQKQRQIAAGIISEEKKLEELKSTRLSVLEERQEQISAITKKHEQHIAELEEKSRAAEKALLHKRRELSIAEKQKAQFDNLKKELESTRILLEKKAEEITAQENDIRQREKELNRKASEVRKHTVKLEEAKRIILQSQQAKIEAEKSARENRRMTEEACRISEETSKKLDELRAEEKRISASKMETDALVGETDEKLKELRAKEKSIIQRELYWLDHHKDIKKLSEELEKAKAIVEEATAAGKGELAALKAEWDTNLAALQETKPFLTAQKKEIDRIIQGDTAALCEKEQEIAEMVKRFGADQKEMAKKEAMLNKKIREFDAAKNKIDKANSLLSERESKVIQQEKLAKKILDVANKAKQLKINVPMLRKEAARLKKEITKFNRMPARRSEAEIMPEPKVRATKPAPAHTAREKAVHARPAVSSLKAHERKKTAPAVDATKDELQEMIEGAKASIQSHDVNTAMSILNDLEAAAKRLSEDDRRQLSYEIRDLRTSIKLAML